MALNALDAGIKQQYEVLGSSPSEIAAEMDIEEAAVKISLYAHSSLYRRNLSGSELDKSLPPGTTKDEDITDDEYKDFLTAYKNLAMTSENEVIQEKALKFLLEAKKVGIGASKLPTVKAGDVINIAVINGKIRDAKLLAKEISAGVLDVMTPNPVAPELGRPQTNPNVPAHAVLDRSAPIEVMSYGD